MRERKVCFIAQFPPPIHGLSKAVDTLYHSKLANDLSFEKVDVKDNKRFLFNIFTILRSHADLYYFTISQSRGGNLRDLIILKLLEKRKVMIHLHGGYYRQLVDNDLPKWQREANFRAIKKLAGAIVLGPSLKNIFEGMLPAEKIFTVPNCVDDGFLISDQEFEEKVASLRQRKVRHVLYLSNFIRTKGYPEVLEMARLEKEHVDAGGTRRFHFDFAGKFFEQREKAFFANYVKDNALEDYITYHSVVVGDEKRELLKRCDIFVLLSRYPKEGQPISILEAMGNGMAIVSTNHAGIPDLVTDGVHGIVVDKDKIEVKGILDKLCDEDYETIAKENRNKIGAMFSEERYINNMSAAFMKVQ